MSETPAGPGAHGSVRTAGTPSRDAMKRRRVGGVRVAAALAGVVFLLLLIFILQNLQSVSVSFFGASGQLPLGVGLLLAAAGGGVLALVLGAARGLQRRTAAWRRRR